MKARKVVFYYDGDAEHGFNLDAGSYAFIHTTDGTDISKLLSGRPLEVLGLVRLLEESAVAECMK